MTKGLLDLLDEVDQLLGGYEPGANDAKTQRKNRTRVQNARLGVQEIRRRIERTGLETKT